DFRGGYAGGRIRNGKFSTDRLDVVAQLTGWATPTASRDEGSIEKKEFRRNLLKEKWNGKTGNGMGLSMFEQAQPPDSGKILNGSNAETENTDQLNPELSRWIMGYPREWANCAPTATRLSRRSRQNS